jgi:hypothetical protein
MTRKKTLTKQVNAELKDLIGWYGVMAILLAYTLLSFKALTPDSLPYQLLNLTGALGIMFEAYSKKDTQPVVLNIVWAFVALLAICRIVIT